MDDEHTAAGAPPAKYGIMMTGRCIAIMSLVMLISGCARSARMGQGELIGTSVQGRPISIYHFGSGSRKMLILAAIHGNETQSAYVTRQLMTELRARKISCNLAIIPVANPDGFNNNVRTNAHHIDLNRNFPASNFKASMIPVYASGKAPLSEPESTAILKIIESFKPDGIISIHTIGQGRHCNNFDGSGEEIARVLAKFNKYPVKDNIGYPTPGSLGSYAADHHLAMVTLELPSAAKAEECWKENREGLMAILK